MFLTGAVVERIPGPFIKSQSEREMTPTFERGLTRVDITLKLVPNFDVCENPDQIEMELEELLTHDVVLIKRHDLIRLMLYEMGLIEPSTIKTGQQRRIV